MAEELFTFQKFHEPEVANDIAEKLKGAGIFYKIENDDKMFDPTFARNPLQNETRIKLRPEDFEKADGVLAEYYNAYANNVDRDYYLFSFTNRELEEILIKPDEWGKLDYQLAQKILTERGETFDITELNYLKTKRLEELARPEKSPDVLIIAGYLFAIAGGIIGIIIGFLLTGSRKTLPNGENIFIYRPADRDHGKLILFIGFAVLLITLVYGRGIIRSRLTVIL